MVSQRGFIARHADWAVDGASLRAVRRSVFIDEQGVPESLEWDAFDRRSRHVIAEADGRPIGTGRLLPDGQIGRLAVLAQWRGRGVGAALLALLLEAARRNGCPQVTLNAQTRAIGFYARFGFRAHGPEFDDAGIPHVRMAMNLEPGHDSPAQRETAG
jgi:YD repeat-containing protein